MPKFEWEETEWATDELERIAKKRIQPPTNTYAGTDGLGIVVTAKQSVINTKPLLHVDLLVYLEETAEDPRPAIEAAIVTLRKELGL